MVPLLPESILLPANGSILQVQPCNPFRNVRLCVRHTITGNGEAVLDYGSVRLQFLNCLDCS